MTAQAHAIEFAKKVGGLTGDSRLEAIDRLGEELEMFDYSPTETFEALKIFDSISCRPSLLPGIGSERMDLAEKVLTAFPETSSLEAELLRLVPPRPPGPLLSRPKLVPVPKPAVTNKFRMRMAGDISLDDLPEFLIDGVVVENSVHAFYGATGAGKTFAAIDMALCVATGSTWFGHETLPAAVLWLAAEDSFGVDKRVKAWLGRTGLTDVPFATLDGGSFNIRNEETIHDIVERAQQLLERIGMSRLLIVADTLSKVSAGTDENSGKDLSEIMAGFDNLRRQLPNATICVIHHSGKSEGAGLRGHSSLGQGIDSFALVKKTSAGHVIEFEKVKNSELPPPIGFALEGVLVGKRKNGKEITSCIVVPRISKPIEIGPINLRGATKAQLAALATAIRDEGVALPDTLTDSPGIHGVTLAQWRNVAHNILHSGKKKSVSSQDWRRSYKLLSGTGNIAEIEWNGETYVYVIDTS